MVMYQSFQWIKLASYFLGKIEKGELAELIGIMKQYRGLNDQIQNGFIRS
jgi:hypothetical protein